MKNSHFLRRWERLYWPRT